MNHLHLNDKHVSYTAGFFMLIAFGVGGLVLGGLVSIPIIMAMTGAAPDEILPLMQKLSGSTEYRSAMQVMQSLSSIFGLLLPTLFTASRLSSKPQQLTGTRGPVSKKQFLLTLVIIVCGTMLSGALGHFSYQLPIGKYWETVFTKMETNYAKMAASLINLDNPLELILSIVVLAFVPAVCEEFFFRGGLQNYMYRSTHRMWLSIIVVSIIFSIVHFSGYGFLSRVALGVVLGLIYQYTGKLWLSILAHFINNAMAIVVLYFQKTNGKSIADIMQDHEGSYWGFLVIPVLIWLFIQLKKTAKGNITAHGI